MLRIAGISPSSTVDGSGVRIVVYFQGCNHNCEGCHNPETWDFQSGVPYKVEELVSELEDMFKVGCYPHRRITLSGGDPIYQSGELSILLRELKDRGWDIWVYTGFLYEEIKKNYKSVLSFIDVLVDGPYKKELSTLEVPFIGSVNQRIIDVQTSLKENRVIQLRRK